MQILKVRQEGKSIFDGFWSISDKKFCFNQLQRCTDISYLNKKVLCFINKTKEKLVKACKTLLASLTVSFLKSLQTAAEVTVK